MIQIRWIEEASYQAWDGDNVEDADRLCKQLESEGIKYSREEWDESKKYRLVMCCDKMAKQFRFTTRFYFNEPVLTLYGDRMSYCPYCGKAIRFVEDK